MNRSMKKLNIVLSLIFFTFFISPQSVFAQEKSVKELLKKITDAELRSSYQGERFIFNFYTPKPNVIRYQIIRIRPGLEKKVLKTLDNKDERIILKDGKNLWEYIPSEKRVIKRSVDPLADRAHTLFKNIDLLKKNYSIKIIDDDIKIADRKSTLVELAPKNNEKRVRYKIWIDKERGIGLKTEIYSPENRLITLSFYSKIDFTPLHDMNKFVLRVPKNTSLHAIKEKRNLAMVSVESLVDFRVQLPKILPGGFVLAGGRVKTLKTTKELHVHYSDGLSGISLFENSSGKMYTRNNTPLRSVDINGNMGNFYKVGLVRLLEWQSKGITIALVGELEEEEFLKIARSIE